MLLRYSFAMDEDATLIEQAATNVLASRSSAPPTSWPPAATQVTTSIMGDNILREVEQARRLGGCPPREGLS